MIRIVYVYLYIGWRLNIEYQINKQERVGECYSMPNDDLFPLYHGENKLQFYDDDGIYFVT